MRLDARQRRLRQLGKMIPSGYSTEDDMLTRILLNLARDHDHPDEGFEILAPFEPDGHLDAAAWRRSGTDAACADSGTGNVTVTDAW